MKLRDLIDRYVIFAFNKNKGNFSATARYLGISIRTLRNYRDRLGLNPKEIVEVDRFDYPFPTNKERLKYLDEPRYKEKNSTL